MMDTHFLFGLIVGAGLGVFAMLGVVAWVTRSVVGGSLW